MSASSTPELLFFTLWTGLCATLCMLPVGISTGFWLAHGRGRGRRAVETLCLLPLVLPPTAVGLLLLYLFQEHGLLGQVMEKLGFPVLFRWPAVVLAGAVMGFPLLVRAARDAFIEVDPRLLGMARSLGKSRTQAFFRVALPLAGRGILGGALLAFARAVGEFGATVLVAGNIPGRTQTLSLAIFERVELGRDESAMKLVAVSGVLAVGAVFGTELLQRTRTGGRR